MGNGGVGSETLRGSRLILRRDLAHMTAQGNAGWLFDIGPGWYAEGEFLVEIRAFVQLGRERVRWNLQSPARVAAMFQPESFFFTAHWKTSPGEGEYDLFGDYFLNRQSRAIHRLGAPVDFLDINDLEGGDASRYRLFLLCNCFALRDEQVEKLRRLFARSGATVVWFYAPGFVCPEGASVERMVRLTGLSLRLLPEAGGMLVDTNGRTFGLPGMHQPRFVVEDASAEQLGRWKDGSGVAFARKQVDGFTSVYVGTAPVPAEILRWLAQEAGVRLWSSQPDIVYACTDAASITATSDGEREIRLPKPMRLWQSDSSRQTVFRLKMRAGETGVFIAS
jgi:hypothetical protein